MVANDITFMAYKHSDLPLELFKSVLVHNQTLELVLIHLFSQEKWRMVLGQESYDKELQTALHETPSFE